jgi:hypothetical protein
LGAPGRSQLPQRTPMQETSNGIATSPYCRSVLIANR